MTLLKDIKHAVGSVSWFIAALRALEDRLISLEASADPKAKTETPKAAEGKKM